MKDIWMEKAEGFVFHQKDEGHLDGESRGFVFHQENEGHMGEDSSGECLSSGE
ncbi:hypothetical protein [Metabacillus niabensis]|uniref:hypothetical protein n=1 Tax=Metabacillus niabensis TaxID=324854 RepID=UPI001CFB6911|nr:hypothetical protein [Metabacillus niabensis]